MTYLLTGATGFLGTRLVARLLADGHSVNYLSSKKSDRLDSRAAFHYWKRGEVPPLDSVPPFDAVIHLAGETVNQRWTKAARQRIWQSRQEGTKELMAAIGRLAVKPSVVVSASAVGYYGDRGAEVLEEESGPGEGFLADVCVEWERQALCAHELGCRSVPVRIGVVLGREGGALKEMLPPFKAGLGGKFGDGAQWMSWIHVDDLIRLFIFASQNTQLDGPLNGVGPAPVTNAGFAKTLGEVLHRPAFLPIPKFTLQLAFGEMASFLFDSARVMPKHATTNGFHFEYHDLRGALENLLKA